MSVDYFMKIKDVGNFDKGSGLENLNTFGIVPLMELTRVVDGQVETLEGEGYDAGLATIMQLNRMIYCGLKDAEEAIYRLFDSHRKNITTVPVKEVA